MHSLRRHVIRSEDGSPVDFSNSSNNKQVLVIQLACGRHTATMQLRSFIRSIQRTHGKQGTQQGTDVVDSMACATALYCKRCGNTQGMSGAMAASHCESRLYCLLQSRFPDVQWQHEQRVCGRPVDVWVPALKLVLQADGAHHFWGPDGTQADSDRRHEQAVLGSMQAKGLLRLHYQDGNDVWAGCVAWALHLARDAGVCSFVVYSPSYSRRPIVIRCHTI